MRDEFPTLPCDLSEYARVNTGSLSTGSLDTGSLDTGSLDADGAVVEDPLDEEVDLRPLSVRLYEVPCVAIAPEECARLGLSHREAYVLGLLDGCSSIEEIIAIGGLPVSETIDALSELCARGAIRLAARGHA